MFDTAVFDLDGILLKDMAMTEGGISAVRSLLASGWNVIYSSGKNYWFTVGGLTFSNLMQKDTIVIAENGGVIFYPHSKETITLSSHGKDVHDLEQEFVERRCTPYRGLLRHRATGAALWQEPKETIFTLYPDNLPLIPAIAGEIMEIIAEQELNLYVIEHSDAIDVLPKGQNKGAALQYISNEGMLDLSRTVAFGDGANDMEMLNIVAMPMTVENANESVKNLVSSRGGYVAAASYGDGVMEGVEWLRSAM